MDAQTLSLILGVAASKGDNVVASTRAAKASAQAAADARDKVTAAELGEAYSYLGLGKLIKEQASGSIATFWTDMAARLKSCKVSMNPVQDLHGYDSPWPAGGGKNLLNPASATELGKTVWFCEPDGFLFKAGVTYTLSVSDSGITSISIYGTDKSTQLAYASGNNISRGAHFTPEVDTYALPRLYSGTFVTQTMIDSTMLEIGATKTSFAPYSNICPITGWTGVNVYRSGYDTSNPDTYAVTIPNDPGTVYGGTLDVVTGELVVDKGCLDLGSLQWGIAGSSCFYNTTDIESFKRATSNAERKTGLLCSSYSPSTNVSFSDLQDDKSFLRGQESSPFDIRIRDTTYSTTSEFKTAMSGVQLVYELATPLTYTLTPVEIQTLTGQNNVWSDAGNVALTYWKRKE